MSLPARRGRNPRGRERPFAAPKGSVPKLTPTTDLFSHHPLPSSSFLAAMDIPNDKSQQSAAPTPMNSLANGGLVNPGTSVAPRVATLGEEDESGANPASMLSRVSSLLSLQPECARTPA